MPCEMELPNSAEQLLADESNNWRELLNDNCKWQSIPLLNYTPLHQLKDHSLVRFRGMIQDMLDPEIYLERYEIKSVDGTIRLQQGKYRDCLHLGQGEELNYNADQNVHGERRTLFVVSVPGLNDWTKEHEKQCNVQPVEPEIQRMAHNGIKRAAEDTKDGMENEAMEVDIPHEMSKRHCVQTVRDVSNVSNRAVSSKYLLNSPLPERPSMACMVKIYENFDAFKLNSLVDFVGYLSVDPALDASTLDINAAQDNGFESVQEIQAQHPPPSLIPRLHAFGVRLLPHANPLLDQTLQQPKLLDGEVQQSKEALHKDLRMLLKLCLFDDELAAEYLLSHLISKVYSRSEMQSIGKFTLNLCNLPSKCLQEYTAKLYEIIQLLLPASHYLPMTLETMNTAAFAPKKDYETNKLVSGILQLAPHTHLILDETHMHQGKLENNGVQAIQQIAHLINNQELRCDFQYYHIDYNADIPVLVLSEGRTLLPSDFILPINPDAKSIELFEESFKAAQHYLQPVRLKQFRGFLTQARISQFNVSEEHTEMIQQDFVEMRKMNAKSSAVDLHGLLVLSRLLGIARGKEALDEETWQLATEFEAKRRQRLQALPKSTVNIRN